MKKSILILLFFIGIWGMNAQDSMQPSITETERIIDKYGEKIVNAFKEGVEKVTPLTEEGFEIVVRLQIAKGIAASIPVLIFIIAVTWMVILYRNKDITPFDDTRSLVAELLFLVFGIISLFTTYIAITHLIAPEWYAVKEIIELF